MIADTLEFTLPGVSLHKSGYHKLYPGLSSFIPTEQDIDLFWSNVEKTPDCWIWKGKQLTGRGKGYGYFIFGGLKVFVHRFSYQLYKGRLGHKMLCCHSCDNPSCVNPDHLWEGTCKQNSDDKHKKGRQPKNSWKTSGLAKLNPRKVIQIREIYALGGITQKQIGTFFGVSLPTVNEVVTRRGWKHVL